VAHDGEDCLKATSPAGFADALASLLDDPDRRDAVGERAATATEPYRLDVVGERLVELYEELTGLSA
jgi:hypothetical protein